MGRKPSTEAGRQKRPVQTRRDQPGKPSSRTPEAKVYSRDRLLVPAAAVATACLGWFSFSPPSPMSLAVLLAAIMALGVPVFEAMRRRWLASRDRRASALLGSLTGLMFLCAVSAAVRVAGIIAT